MKNFLSWVTLKSDEKIFVKILKLLKFYWSQEKFWKKFENPPKIPENPKKEHRF